jgi:hypothetical protein
MLDLTIGNFDLATRLWVIRGGNLVGDELLLHQLLKNPVAEMLASIIYDCSRCTKPSKDSVSQKLDHDSVVISLASNGLHPLGHIVHSNQDVQISIGVGKWSHEINAPHIKDLHDQNRVEGHHISPTDTP